jgi:N-acetylmuramoyl-L-alanine amidase
MGIMTKIIDFIKALFDKTNNEEQIVVEEKNDEVFVDEIVVNKEENTMNEIIEGAAMEAATPRKMYNGLVVVLDPGHAITTQGKKSPYSLKKVSSPEIPFEEWEFNREIAYTLKPMLKELGIDVFITTDAERDKDTDLGLSKRAGRANDYVKKSGKKGVYISIHSDADGMGDKWTKAHGWSCFTTKGQNNSDKLADCLYDAAEELLKPLDKTIRVDRKDGDRDWEEGFTVLVKANMPAVLTENFFYTNIDDAMFITSDEGKNTIARVHLLGILKFADTFYKM